MIPVATHFHPTTARFGFLEVQVVVQPPGVHQLVIGVAHDRFAQEIEAVDRVSIAPCQLGIRDTIQFLVYVQTEDDLRGNRQR